MPSAPRVIRRSEVVPDPERWVLTEEKVPQSHRHLLVSERIRHLLLGWAERTGRAVQVGSDLALRWDPKRRQFGIDPDVYVVEPPPPGGDDDDVASLLLWQPGNHPPLLAVEVVSPSHPTKDYVAAPLKYALCGVGELWILDPKLVGPRSDGGPYRIQVWRRLDSERFVRIYAGDGPAWSLAIEAWVRAAEGERSIDLASDEAGLERWLTPREAERAAKEAERAAKEAALRRADTERAAKEAALRRADTERAAKEAALRRIADLEAQLGRSR